MSVTLSQENLKRFQAYRNVLGILKNNGSATPKKITHDDVMEFLYSHSPIKEEVEDFMKQSEKISKKISEKRTELITKTEVLT
ncbi:MAG: hypothetical protein PHW62_01620 [Candidatus Ratteibacteria bacterium]|nr:hypothetical protein [Candidatus Ratteibacteria bacterium]